MLKRRKSALEKSRRESMNRNVRRGRKRECGVLPSEQKKRLREPSVKGATRQLEK